VHCLTGAVSTCKDDCRNEDTQYFLRHTRLAQDGVPMCVYEEAPWIGTASAAVDRLARRVMRASTSGGGWYGP
jgi:hypothetical protein